MTGDAVAGVVTGALGSLGTPNLLLQTDLTQVPTIGISPAALPPALLYEGSFGVAATQTLTLSNGANTSVAFNVRGVAAACLPRPGRRRACCAAGPPAPRARQHTLERRGGRR